MVSRQLGGGRLRSLILPALFMALRSIAPTTEVLARENFIGNVVYFSGDAGSSEEVTSLVAQRYMWAESGTTNSLTVERVRALNPAFRFLAYNSLTDNYDNNATPGYEQAVIDSICDAHGWSREEAYLHFYEDTWIDRTNYGTNPPSHTFLFVPGCGPGGPTRESRIPCMTKVPLDDVGSRKAANFSTPTAMDLQKRVFLRMGVDRPFQDGRGHYSAIYPDGIFCDNAAYVYWGFGGGDWSCWSDSVHTAPAGRVWESAPGDPANMVIMGTTERSHPGHSYDKWHWERNTGPFLTALRDTLEQAETWHPDRRRKYLSINTANAYTSDYITRHSADILFIEFEGNPIRTWWPPIDVVRQRNIDLANAGMTQVYGPVPTSGYGEVTLTLGERMEGALAYYLLVRSDDTQLEYQTGVPPGEAGWDTLAWHPCFDVIRTQLGFFTGEPYLVSSGTDPLGQPYKVWGREYENGFILLRKREDWNQVMDAATAVTVTLPKALRRLDADGNIGDPVTTVSMPNGRGFLFLAEVENQPPAAAFEGTPRTGNAPLGVAFADRSTWYPTSWLWAFGDGDTSAARNPTHTYLAPGSYDVTLIVANAQGADTLSMAGYVSVLPLDEAPGAAEALSLKYSQPNPFKESAIVLFTIPSEGDVNLSVFSAEGRHVATLVDDWRTAGEHRVLLDSREWVGGLYLFRLSWAGQVRSVRGVVVR